MGPVEVKSIKIVRVWKPEHLGDEFWAPPMLFKVFSSLLDCKAFRKLLARINQLGLQAGAFTAQQLLQKECNSKITLKFIHMLSFCVTVKTCFECFKNWTPRRW